MFINSNFASHSLVWRAVYTRETTNWQHFRRLKFCVSAASDDEHSRVPTHSQSDGRPTTPSVTVDLSTRSTWARRVVSSAYCQNSFLANHPSDRSRCRCVSVSRVCLHIRSCVFSYSVFLELWRSTQTKMAPHFWSRKKRALELSNFSQVRKVALALIDTCSLNVFHLLVYYDVAFR